MFSVLDYIGCMMFLFCLRDFDGSYLYELWTTDGTSSGTNLLKDIYPGNRFNGSFPDNFTNLDLAGNNDYVYFSANDGSNGNELWRTDGTSSGTTLVHNFTGNSSHGGPSGFVQLGDYLYFSAQNSSRDKELYRTNGTSTSLVKNTDPSGSGKPTSLTKLNDDLIIFFKSPSPKSKYFCFS